MEKKYEMIFGETEIKGFDDFFRSNINTIEIIPVILQVKKNLVMDHKTYLEIIGFFKNVLDEKFNASYYNLFMTNDLENALLDDKNKENLKKPIQVCFLEDKIASFDSRSSIHQIDSTISNLKYYIQKQTRKSLFFLIIPVFLGERLRPGFMRSLQNLNRIIYIEWK